MYCAYHKVKHVDIVNCSHTACISHSHCLSPTICQLYKYCPLNTLEYQKIKNPQVVEKEKEAARKQLIVYNESNNKSNNKSNNNLILIDKLNAIINQN